MVQGAGSCSHRPAADQRVEGAREPLHSQCIDRVRARLVQCPSTRSQGQGVQNPDNSGSGSANLTIQGQGL